MLGCTEICALCCVAQLDKSDSVHQSGLSRSRGTPGHSQLTCSLSRALRPLGRGSLACCLSRSQWLQGTLGADPCWGAVQAVELGQAGRPANVQFE